MSDSQTLTTRGGANSLSQSRSVTADSNVLKTLEFLNGRSGESVIVEQGKTSSGWWRKWSDGFIEQSGYASANNGRGITISFYKSFSNTKYLFLSTSDADTDNLSCIAVHIEKTGRSNTSCRVNVAWASGGSSGSLTNTFSYSWYAAGY